MKDLHAKCRRLRNWSLLHILSRWVWVPLYHWVPPQMAMAYLLPLYDITRPASYSPHSMYHFLVLPLTVCSFLVHKWLCLVPMLLSIQCRFPGPFLNCTPMSLSSLFQFSICLQLAICLSVRLLLNSAICLALWDLSHPIFILGSQLTYLILQCTLGIREWKKCPKVCGSERKRGYGYTWKFSLICCCLQPLVNPLLIFYW